MNIVNRSKMGREELIKAIKGFEYVEQGQEKVLEKEQVEEPALSEKTMNELYDLARERKIEGRSEMKKNELVKALDKELVKEKELT
jgi:hypothetical protein